MRQPDLHLIQELTALPVTRRIPVRFKLKTKKKRRETSVGGLQVATDLVLSHVLFCSGSHLRLLCACACADAWGSLCASFLLQLGNNCPSSFSDRPLSADTLSDFVSFAQRNQKLGKENQRKAEKCLKVSWGGGGERRDRDGAF